MLCATIAAGTDDMVAAIHVGGEGRLVLAAQAVRDDRGDSADDEAFRADQKAIVCTLLGCHSRWLHYATAAVGKLHLNSPTMQTLIMENKMNSVVELLPSRRTEANVEGHNLVSVTGYDPHLPRCIEAIKHALFAGNPVIIRLHAAADYPINGDAKYQIDQEGQAVLIVGYDEEIGALAIVDPFARDRMTTQSERWNSVRPYSHRTFAL